MHPMLNSKEKTSLPRYWKYIDVGLALAFILMIFSLTLFGYYLLLTRSSGQIEIAFASLILGIVSIFVTIVLAMLTLRAIKMELA